MGVALFIWKDLILCRKARIPSSVFGIVKFSTKTFQPRVRQFLAARVSQKGADTVYVGHPGSDPGLTVSFLPRGSVISQIIGTALGRRKSVSEFQKVLPDLLLKFSVFFCVNLIFFQYLAHFHYLAAFFIF